MPLNRVACWLDIVGLEWAKIIGFVRMGELVDIQTIVNYVGWVADHSRMTFTLRISVIINGLFQDVYSL